MFDSIVVRARVSAAGARGGWDKQALGCFARRLTACPLSYLTGGDVTNSTSLRSLLTSGLTSHRAQHWRTMSPQSHGLPKVRSTAYSRPRRNVDELATSC
jgi:hypothetical protein